MQSIASILIGLRCRYRWRDGKLWTWLGSRVLRLRNWTRVLRWGTIAHFWTVIRNGCIFVKVNAPSQGSKLTRLCQRLRVFFFGLLEDGPKGMYNLLTSWAIEYKFANRYYPTPSSHRMSQNWSWSLCYILWAHCESCIRCDSTYWDTMFYETRRGWKGYMSWCALFPNFVTVRCDIILCIDGYHAISDQSHLWFSVDMKRRITTYVVVNCPQVAKATLLESIQSAPERFLDPFAVDVLLSDCYLWDCAQKVEKERGRLLLYVRYFSLPIWVRIHGFISWAGKSQGL